MAKIIIQGTKEEIKKTESVLKAHFSAYENKTTVQIDGEFTAIADAYLNRTGADGFSDEEIEKAATICGTANRNCPECPYFKEPNCEKAFIIDYTVYVNRLLSKQCSGEMVHGKN